MDITGYLFVLLVLFLAVFSKIYLSRSGQSAARADLSAFDYKPKKEEKESEGKVLKKIPSHLRLRPLKGESSQPDKGTVQEPTKVEIEKKEEKREDKKEEKAEEHKEAPKEPVKEVEETKEKIEEKPAVKVEEVKEAEEEQEEKDGEVGGEDDEAGEEEEEEDENEDEDEEDEDEEEEGKNLKEVLTNGTGPANIVAGCASLQGKRPNNEDRSIIHFDEEKEVGIFGVFDGHDGPKASDYCAKYMARNILNHKSIKTAAGGGIAKAILEGVKKTDKKFLDKVEQGGSTAIVGVIGKNTLYVANVGDSRCVVSVAGKAVALSIDHKPNLPEEKERINATAHELQETTEVVDGKRVKVFRIDGALAVSRAIGDIDFKDDPDKSPAEQAVSPIPDIQTVKLTKEHEFAILACDGLWDVLSNEEAVDFVKEKIAAASTPEEITDIAKSLASNAISKGSKDNVTVLIVKF